LNAILVGSFDEREALLAYSNGAGVMARPVWKLMHRLPAFAAAQRDSLENSEWLEARLVNIPSSVRVS
jgi:dTDP-4-amino-4,6-dideoxygalactose transaminase